MLELLQDKIAAVRLQASHLAASITEHLMNNEEETEGSLAESFVDNVSFIFILSVMSQNGRNPHFCIKRVIPGSVLPVNVKIKKYLGFILYVLIAKSSTNTAVI